MGAGRHQAKYIFQRHLGQRQRCQGPVDCGDDDGSARGQHGGDGGGEQPPVGDMFDHLGRIDDIEHRPGLGKSLGGHAAIVDVEAALCGVRAGRIDGLRRGVDSCHRTAKPGHGLCQQSTAAADIKNTNTVQILVGRILAGRILGGRILGLPAGADPVDAVKNVVDAYRREIMQRGHRALGIPPLR